MCLESSTDGRTDANLGQVMEINWTAIDGFHHDALKVLDRCSEPYRTHHEFLVVLLDELSTDIEIVRLDLFDEFL